jgi:hypothetical protein
MNTVAAPISRIGRSGRTDGLTRHMSEMTENAGLSAAGHQCSLWQFLQDPAVMWSGLMDRRSTCTAHAYC